MKREIVFYGDHFFELYHTLNEKAKEKLEYIFDLIRYEERVPSNFLKCLEGTDQLYEVRVKITNNIYRISCFFDKGKLVVLLNGFQKKTQKTPLKEIKLAERLKKQYYEDGN